MVILETLAVIAIGAVIAAVLFPFLMLFCALVVDAFVWLLERI